MSSSRFAHVTVAIDGSPNSDDALDAAIDLAIQYRSELTILTVAPLAPIYMPAANSYMATPVSQSDTGRYQALIEAAVKYAQNAGATTVTGVCQEGVVVDEILAFLDTHPADVVVVGSRGMSAAKRLLIGSISSALVAHAPCPVLVVRSRPTTKPAA
jgi:nucleotide-binding universal stress UspA family protein